MQKCLASVFPWNCRKYLKNNGLQWGFFNPHPPDCRAVEILTYLQGLHCLTSVQVDCIELLLSALYITTKSLMKYGSWIHKYSFHVWNRNLSYVSFEFISMNLYAIFHYWIWYYEFRILNPLLFSVVNSYLRIHLNEFRFMNLDWIQWILISEFMHLWIHIRIQSIYIWIHIHEFIHSWIHIFISPMNSHVYEFI